MTYAPQRLYEEVAYVAYHFHWGAGRILDLEHPQRLRFVDEIARHQHAARRGAVSDALALVPPGRGAGTAPATAAKRG